MHPCQRKLSSFFIFARRAACPLTEEIGKVMFIGKLQAVSDFLDGKAGIPEKEAGGVDFAGQDIFIRRLSRSEEHTSELQSPYVISYAVFCLKKKFF